MATTLFDLTTKKKNNKKSFVNKEKILLIKKEIETIPSSFTYIDYDNKEKKTSDFYKDIDGSYVLNKVSIESHPIYEKVEIEYEQINEHYSYLDKDGIKREFNNLDTLQYDEETNTYSGLVSEIEYVSTPVEVFINEKN